MRSVEQQELRFDQLVIDHCIFTNLVIQPHALLLLSPSQHSLTAKNKNFSLVHENIKNTQMRFLLGQKQALLLSSHQPTETLQNTIFWGREWKLSRATNVAAGNNFLKIGQASHVMRVREAAGRFKREGLGAAERCQQCVSKSI